MVLKTRWGMQLKNDTIGVTESTIWNCEHGTEPELVHIPGSLRFSVMCPGSVLTTLLAAWLILKRSRVIASAWSTDGEGPGAARGLAIRAQYADKTKSADDS